MNAAQPILGFFDEHRWLSNFEGPGFMLAGFWWPTNEHYYQAMKSDDEETQHQIRTADTPGKAKKIGRRIEIRENWDDLKDGVMHIGLRCKFAFGMPIGLVEPSLANRQAQAKLLATKDAYLEETNHWHDTYWGVCAGVGENKLGHMLMELRAEIRESLVQP